MQIITKLVAILQLIQTPQLQGHINVVLDAYSKVGRNKPSQTITKQKAKFCFQKTSCIG